MAHMISRADRDRQHAVECAEMARMTFDPHIQHACLALEKQWLMLAKQAEARSQFRLRVPAFGRRENLPDERPDIGTGNR
jgi:hypothetical protein